EVLGVGDLRAVAGGVGALGQDARGDGDPAGAARGVRRSDRVLRALRPSRRDAGGAEGALCRSEDRHVLPPLPCAGAHFAHTCTRGGTGYSPGTSASCAWPIARRRRRSSSPQSKMTFWACTASTASSGTRNSPAFSTYTTRPSGDTSRTAPNSSSPSEANVWYPTSIVSRMIHS